MARRKLSRFICKELLYDYVQDRLDDERKAAVHFYVQNDDEFKKEVSHIKYALGYTDLLQAAQVSAKITERFEAIQKEEASNIIPKEYRWHFAGGGLAAVSIILAIYLFPKSYIDQILKSPNSVILQEIQMAANDILPMDDLSDESVESAATEDFGESEILNEYETEADKNLAAKKALEQEAQAPAKEESLVAGQEQSEISTTTIVEKNQDSKLEIPNVSKSSPIYSAYGPQKNLAPIFFGDANHLMPNWSNIIYFNTTAATSLAKVTEAQVNAKEQMGKDPNLQKSVAMIRGKENINLAATDASAKAKLQETLADNKTAASRVAQMANQNLADSKSNTQQNALAQNSPVQKQLGPSVNEEVEGIAAGEQAVDSPSASSESVASKKVQGFVYWSYMRISSFEEKSVQITQTIEKLGGIKAGQVPLGWHKPNGRKYYHFAMPEENFNQLQEYLRSLGTSNVVKSIHPRVMPKGQVRMILELGSL